MIVLDASVLIAWFDGGDTFHDRARRELSTAVASPLRASAVTLAEVLVAPTRTGTVTLARRALSGLQVEAVAVGTDAPERLAALRTATGLKLPDCCVLLAAQDAGAQAVLTYDERLRVAAFEAGYRTDP